jgi:lactocepin
LLTWKRSSRHSNKHLLKRLVLPDRPAQSALPVLPELQVKLVQPVLLEKLVLRDQRGKWGRPVQLVKLVLPDRPVQLVKPVLPDRPVQLVKPVLPDRPALSVKPVPPDLPVRWGQKGKKATKAKKVNRDRKGKRASQVRPQ